MVRWSLPLGHNLLRSYIALLFFCSLFAIIDFLEYGLKAVLIAMMMSAIILLVGYLLMIHRLGDLHDHELSRWKMDKDQVLRRLAQAMAARGARPQLETKDEMVWFLLPPLSIVVGRAWWATTVYVGPSTDETELLVERLENFVERALA